MNVKVGLLCEHTSVKKKKERKPVWIIGDVSPPEGDILKAVKRFHRTEANPPMMTNVTLLHIYVLGCCH